MQFNVYKSGIITISISRFGNTYEFDFKNDVNFDDLFEDRNELLEYLEQGIKNSEYTRTKH